MSVYLFFVGFVLATVGVGFVWLLLAAAGLVPDPTDPDPLPEHDDELRRLLAESDTPIHDAVWASHLRADIDNWGGA